MSFRDDILIPGADPVCPPVTHRDPPAPSDGRGSAIERDDQRLGVRAFAEQTTIVAGSARELRSAQQRLGDQRDLHGVGEAPETVVQAGAEVQVGAGRAPDPEVVGIVDGIAVEHRRLGCRERQRARRDASGVVGVSRHERVRARAAQHVWGA
jgi:hypothetical protein